VTADEGMLLASLLTSKKRVLKAASKICSKAQPQDDEYTENRKSCLAQEVMAAYLKPELPPGSIFNDTNQAVATQAKEEKACQQVIKLVGDYLRAKNKKARSKVEQRLQNQLNKFKSGGK